MKRLAVLSLAFLWYNGVFLGKLILERFTDMPTEPRSGNVEVGGVRWLGRMIDKARLEANGEIDALDLEYPCPMDQRLLSEMGVDPDKFQELAVGATTDEQIIVALKNLGVKVLN